MSELYSCYGCKNALVEGVFEPSCYCRIKEEYTEEAIDCPDYKKLEDGESNWY